MIALNEWKYFPFKAPHRKNYKDLDRQVETFVQEEQKNLEKHSLDKGISIGDWINFTVSVINNKQMSLNENFSQNFWLKLDNEDIEGHLQFLFLGKKKGEDFIVAIKVYKIILVINYEFLIILKYMSLMLCHMLIFVLINLKIILE